MRIAFVVYDGMTALDLIGVYDPVTRLKTMGFLTDLRWDICGRTPQVHDGTGLVFTPTQVNQPLDNYDIVIVPGGLATRQLVDDADFIAWLATAEPCPLKVSVCTGALLLGAAGFLEDKVATTHRSAFRDLEPYCMRVLDRRIVDEGMVITARGVSSSIDLGLYLCGKLAGRKAQERIRQQIDYEGLA